MIKNLLCMYICICCEPIAGHMFILVGSLSIVQSEVVLFRYQVELFESWPNSWKAAEWYTNSPNKHKVTQVCQTDNLLPE